MAVQKMKYPMDLTLAESTALTDAATYYQNSKKGLIFAALKLAYGVEPGKPIPQPQHAAPSPAPARPQ